MAIELALKNLVQAFREKNANLKAIVVDEEGLSAIGELFQDATQYVTDKKHDKLVVGSYAEVEIRKE